MKHIGLFEGIGGFSLAARKMGWHTIAWCEINPFCQKVLSYHFPEATPHNDITTTDFTVYRGKCDILTGGFPCQPYSVAGKRLGKEDDRHLWPQMLRAIREIQPAFVVGENVGGLISWNGGLVFHEVQADLEAEGYEVQSFVLPACGVNAPHRRDRVWIVAYANSKRRKRRLYSTKCEAAKRYISSCNAPCDPSNPWHNFATQSPICSGDDGLFTELLRQRIRADSMGHLSEKEINKIISKAIIKWRKESIKAYGNSIVHQVALQIFKAIQQTL